MKDKISIIIPVYNVEKYLDKCLNSVLNQTYNNIEVICINDGSKDSSLNLLNNYSSIDKRIKVFSRENKGLLYTRVDGVKKATGEYIVFLDSDDWIDDDYIETLYNNFDSKKINLVRCNMRLVKDENTVISNKKDFENAVIERKEIYKELCRNYKFNNAVRQIFKKSLIIDNIDEIETKISLGEDLEFNLCLYQNINSIKTIDYYGYNYRQNSTSITKKLSAERLKKNVQDTIDVYYNLVCFTKKYNYSDCQISLARMLMQVTNHLIRLSFVNNLKLKEYENLVTKFLNNNKIDYLMKNLEYNSINSINNKKKFLNKMIYKNSIRSFCVCVLYLYKPLYKVIKKG